jgi:hypothetical protein
MSQEKTLRMMLKINTLMKVLQVVEVKNNKEKNVDFAIFLGTYFGW